MAVTGDEVVTLSQFKLLVGFIKNPFEIVPWSTGTDEQIAAMVTAADLGLINLSDYWNVGDTRTTFLNFPSESIGALHAPQDVEFVLTDPGHFILENGKPCSFVVLQKDCLNESSWIGVQSSNSGGWNECLLRSWCNQTYRHAISSILRPIFKQFKTYAADGGGSTCIESLDYFSFFSEKEVLGTVYHADPLAEENNTQLDWFKNKSNYITSDWWTRSPVSQSINEFCVITEKGTSSNAADAEAYRFVAPFGCI